MIYLQHALVEELIERRQIAMRAADQHAPAFHPKRLEDLERQVHTAAMIAAVKFADEPNFALLCDVLEQMASEIAGARDAVEHERALRRKLDQRLLRPGQGQPVSRRVLHLPPVHRRRPEQLPRTARRPRPGPARADPRARRHRRHRHRSPGRDRRRAAGDVERPPLEQPVMRLFELVRTEDVTGVSGTGVVAEGVQHSDGRVSMRWIVGQYRSTALYDSIDAIVALHGHDGRTTVRWIP